MIEISILQLITLLVLSFLLGLCLMLAIISTIQLNKIKRIVGEERLKRAIIEYLEEEE